MDLKSVKIRLIKVILDNGEIGILAASLIDEEKYSKSYILQGRELK
ncbi:MAG: hypothetical protein KAK00_05955 [Nanoarchaeota archaeon]|nr:hypothetical protein [Thermodesulfovibrionia bacterium]MCK5282927.1 hypothetical protein [Nanoarchaeota archaeon]